MSISSFDERAATWDTPDKVERVNAIAAAIGEAIPLNTRMRMLEYGAGTGLVTEALQGRVGPVTLVDTSAGMRAVMEGKIASGILPEARVWNVDLADGSVPNERFDVIVTAMVLHHVADVDHLLANFAALLEPGGYVCIVDLDVEDGSFHGEGFGGHHGFDRDDLAHRLGTAGFSTVAVSDCYRLEKDNGIFSLFLATAQLPGRVRRMPEE
jgi:predicted TPR repeat methyltransferase